MAWILAAEAVDRPDPRHHQAGPLRGEHRRCRHRIGRQRNRRPSDGPRCDRRRRRALSRAPDGGRRSLVASRARDVAGSPLFDRVFAMQSTNAAAKTPWPAGATARHDCLTEAPTFPGDAADGSEAIVTAPTAQEDVAQGWRVLGILSALMGFASISTDLYLPAIPEMGHCAACRTGPGRVHDLGLSRRLQPGAIGLGSGRRPIRTTPSGRARSGAVRDRFGGLRHVRVGMGHDRLADRAGPRSVRERRPCAGHGEGPLHWPTARPR